MRIPAWTHPKDRSCAVASVCFGLLVATAACGGGAETSDTSQPAVVDSARAGAPSGATGAPPAGATAAMVAEGDSIFQGQKAGGLCFTCHGSDANGTALAPSLRDTTWRTGDGSYEFIQKRVAEGVPAPTAPYAAPMPPMGGASLTPDQVKSVAAYVYAISHR